MPTLSEQAIAQVKAEKPSQFTVGAQFRDGKLVGGATYDRKWSNGWGATAYFWAWYDDLPVSVTSTSVSVKKPSVEAGIEVSRKF